MTTFSLVSNVVGREKMLATLTVRAVEGDRIAAPVGQELALLSAVKEPEQLCLYETSGS